MASSPPNLAVLAALLTLLPSPSSSQEGPQRQPISLDADSSTFDRKTNMVSFLGLRIRQGDLGIEADEAQATGLDFGKSEWHFKGNVRITLDSAVIRSDAAHFNFEAHTLASGELTGNPAVFEARSPTLVEPIRGGANRLQYSSVDHTLRLLDSAWLNEGPNEIKGCDLIYDLAEERVTSGSSDCGEPVRITIQPPAEGAETGSPASP